MKELLKKNNYNKEYKGCALSETGNIVLIILTCINIAFGAFMIIFTIYNWEKIISNYNKKIGDILVGYFILAIIEILMLIAILVLMIRKCRLVFASFIVYICIELLGYFLFYSTLSEPNDLYRLIIPVFAVFYYKKRCLKDPGDHFNDDNDDQDESGGNFSKKYINC